MGRKSLFFYLPINQLFCVLPELYYFTSPGCSLLNAVFGFDYLKGIKVLFFSTRRSMPPCPRHSLWPGGYTRRGMLPLILLYMLLLPVDSQTRTQTPSQTPSKSRTPSQTKTQTASRTQTRSPDTLSQTPTQSVSPVSPSQTQSFPFQVRESRCIHIPFLQESTHDFPSPSAPRSMSMTTRMD